MTPSTSRSFLASRAGAAIVQVHGGAWNIPTALREAHGRGVRAAHAHATRLLGAGTPPLEVVAETLAVLEDDPTFDAGHGSFLNEHGRVELDAAVMEGSALRAGAVAGIGAFPNPGRVALAVLERTPHVLLVGSGAEAFAEAEGFTRVAPESLVHPRERAAHAAWVAAGRPDARVFFADPTRSDAGEAPERRGTVGVVLAVPRAGGGYSLFAGTSTGGTPGKRAGRVGDVPLPGAGLYADDEGAAVSATGWGEGLVRVVAAKAVSDRVAAGAAPQVAVEAVLRDLHRRTGGRGGLIAVDAQGRTGAAFSTPDMAYSGPSCAALVL